MTKYYALDEKSLIHRANELCKCDICDKIFFSDECHIAEWREPHGEIYRIRVCPHCHAEDITEIDETDFDTLEEMEDELYENGISIEDLTDYDDIALYFMVDTTDYEYTDEELDQMAQQYEYQANISNEQKLIGAQ